MMRSEFVVPRTCAGSLWHFAQLWGSAEKRPLGLKPGFITNALRGAEAPLFHGGACIPEFFRSL